MTKEMERVKSMIIIVIFKWKKMEWKIQRILF